MTIKPAIKVLQWNIQEDHQTGDFSGSLVGDASWGAPLTAQGGVCEENVLL